MSAKEKNIWNEKQANHGLGELFLSRPLFIQSAHLAQCFAWYLPVVKYNLFNTWVIIRLTMRCCLLYCSKSSKYFHSSRLTCRTERKKYNNNNHLTKVSNWLYYSHPWMTSNQKSILRNKKWRSGKITSPHETNKNYLTIAWFKPLTKNQIIVTLLTDLCGQMGLSCGLLKWQYDVQGHIFNVKTRTYDNVKQKIEKHNTGTCITCAGNYIWINQRQQ